MSNGRENAEDPDRYASTQPPSKSQKRTVHEARSTHAPTPVEETSTMDERSGMHTPGPASDFDHEPAASDPAVREASIGHVLQVMKHFRDLGSPVRQEVQLHIPGVGHVACWYHKGARPLKGIVVNGVQTFSTFSKFRDFATLQVEAEAPPEEAMPQDYESWSFEGQQHWRTEPGARSGLDKLDMFDRGIAASTPHSPSSPGKERGMVHGDAALHELYDASAMLLQMRRPDAWRAAE